MSLKIKYILFIGLLHSILVVLIYHVLKEQKWLFIGSEIVILLSLYLSYLLYKALIKPIDLMQSGTDAIADNDFTVKYLKTGSKEVDKLVEVFNNMIDQLRTERTHMTEQSYFLQNLLSVAPMGTIICDLDGKMNSINPAAKKMLGLKVDHLGKSLNEINNDLAISIDGLEMGTSQMISTNGIDKYKCQISEVIHQGFKRKFILIDDLSTEILQSEKEAFGRIIRMMAHEVNNSMGAVNSILDTVVQYGFYDNKDPELKSSLMIAIERNQSLSRFMANYASILRLPEASLQPLDLNKLLKKCGQLYTPIANAHDISIAYELSPDQPTISGDLILLEQAISNIIKNAIESIAEDGDIIISTQINPLGFVIADNGVGISQDHTAKLFTPFFSTKPTGQGVGLMLIRDILIKHKADFSLKTDQESGMTTFTVNF